MDFFELTTEPLDIGEIVRRVVPSECGATVTLDGYVREFTKGKQTSYLVYEAYEPMAVSEMQKLGPLARAQFEVSHIGIVHRLGKLEIGETSVVVTVAAPHRKAAFAACEWLITELKRTVPIWKKEFYADGSHWVEGENK
jgi:molybdopterin synthase catalytic subunit